MLGHPDDSLFLSRFVRYVLVHAALISCSSTNPRTLYEIWICFLHGGKGGKNNEHSSQTTMKKFLNQRQHCPSNFSLQQQTNLWRVSNHCAFYSQHVFWEISVSAAHGWNSLLRFCLLIALNSARRNYRRTRFWNPWPEGPYKSVPQICVNQFRNSDQSLSQFAWKMWHESGHPIRLRTNNLLLTFPSCAEEPDANLVTNDHMRKSLIAWDAICS